MYTGLPHITALREKCRFLGTSRRRSPTKLGPFRALPNLLHFNFPFGADRNSAALTILSWMVLTISYIAYWHPKKLPCHVLLHFLSLLNSYIYKSSNYSLPYIRPKRNKLFIKVWAERKLISIRVIYFLPCFIGGSSSCIFNNSSCDHSQEVITHCFKSTHWFHCIHLYVFFSCWLLNSI